MIQSSWRTRFIVVIAALAGACGGGSTSYTAEDIDGATPSGRIESVEWEMATAIARPDPFDDGEISVTLYGDAVDGCNSFASTDVPFVIFSVPAIAGEYPLSFDFSSGGRTITLVEPPNNNIIATTGLITVSNVTDDSVTIGLVADAGPSSFINGTFTAELCP